MLSRPHDPYSPHVPAPPEFSHAEPAPELKPRPVRRAPARKRTRQPAPRTTTKRTG